MNGVLAPLLYGLSGVCVCAAWHHGLLAWRQPTLHIHMYFAAMCVALACYVIGEANAYGVSTAESLVRHRSVQFFFAGLFFSFMAWFVAEYTGVRVRALLWSINGLFAAVIVANAVLPYGLGYVEMPAVRYIELPWGERVVDLRMLRPTSWHHLGWLGIFIVLGYGIFACLKQYRGGARRRANVLALGLSIFSVCVLFNVAINRVPLDFVHTAHFGFIGLIAIMSVGLAKELRDYQQRLQAILDQVPAVVYIKELNGRYVSSTGCSSRHSS